MNIEELINYFKTHKGSLKRSNKETAKRTKSSIDDVIKARFIYKNKYQIPAIAHTESANIPKILIFDIETAPMSAYVWRTFKENISLDQMLSNTFIICWSAKWLYSTEVFGECLTPEEIIDEDDSRIVKKLHDVFNEASIIVAHNSKRFDIPKANARFIINNLPPVTPYRVIDTLEVAKKQFAFDSNKLDALASYFNIPTKLDTDFSLWKECMFGNQEALDYMFKYNKKDVEILEEVYLKLLPWIKNHPNMGTYFNNPTCSNCGNQDIVLQPNTYYYTNIGKYPVYKCKCCGSYSRGRKSVKQSVLNSIAT